MSTGSGGKWVSGRLRMPAGTNPHPHFTAKGLMPVPVSPEILTPGMRITMLGHNDPSGSSISNIQVEALLTAGKTVVELREEIPETIEPVELSEQEGCPTEAPLHFVETWQLSEHGPSYVSETAAGLLERGYKEICYATSLVRASRAICHISRCGALSLLRHMFTRPSNGDALEPGLWCDVSTGILYVFVRAPGDMPEYMWYRRGIFGKLTTMAGVKRIQAVACERTRAYTLGIGSDGGLALYTSVVMVWHDRAVSQQEYWTEVNPSAVLASLSASFPGSAKHILIGIKDKKKKTGTIDLAWYAEFLLNIYFDGGLDRVYSFAPSEGAEPMEPYEEATVRNALTITKNRAYGKST